MGDAPADLICLPSHAAMAQVPAALVVPRESIKPEEIEEWAAFPMSNQNAIPSTELSASQHLTVDPDVPLTEVLRLRGHVDYPQE
jgi:hypothetical protein